MTKVLIVHPDLQRLGGIETYYIKLFPRLNVSYESFPIARRAEERGILSRVSRIFSDYSKFWSRLDDSSINIVHLNPSLETKSFFREGLFLLLAKIKRKKVLVFFHGWSLDFQKRIDFMGGWFFRFIYGKANAFIVLAHSFSEKLKNWGIKSPIYSEVTIINDEVIEEFDFPSALNLRLKTPKKKILFASRLMQSKGIVTTMKAFQIIQEKGYEVELIIAGDGEFYEQAMLLAKKLEIENVYFLGSVSIDKVYEQMRTSHILCFPTEHDEGFPNTIVEAMAFGLPVLTRPMGGIADFFIAKTNGYITESTSPIDFANFMIKTIDNQENYRKMSKHNYDYAQNNFLASRSARRMEDIYKSLIK